jgi:hypothetical protein
MPVVVMIFHY